MPTGEPRESNARNWAYLAAASLLTLPAILIHYDAVHPSLEVETVMFGLAILGAAFMLSWAAEVAQLDVSQGLAIAFLALIAVLPEYAVDMVFAWKAGRQDKAAGGLADLCGENPCRDLAIANMTGANRLLIGIGWATVVLVWWWRSKQRSVTLPESRRVDLGMMTIATAWAITIVIRESASIVDTIVLVGLFAWYIWHTTVEEQEHPELVGPPVLIALLGTARRRLVTLGMFTFSAIVILFSAEPFAHGLVDIGERFDISPFLLVQWLAPLASEAPEMIIAVLFVLRARPAQGLGALVSSKVNQWTLLVGTLPLVYGIARGSMTASLHFGERQVEEVLLTAAQSLFASAVLANLTISRGEAAGLLVLFMAQFGFESTTVRYGFAIAYFTLCFLVLARDGGARRSLIMSLRHAMSIPKRPPAAG